MEKIFSRQRLIKKRAGQIAKKKGEHFEMFIEHNAHVQKLFPIRIPDGCKVTKANQGIRLVRVQTPFDFILIGHHLSIFIDTKTTEGSTFPYSQIKLHQLQNLLEASKAGPAGYLVNFETIKAVVFFSAHKLDSVKKQSSLKPADGLFLGSTSDFNLKLIAEDWIKDDNTYPLGI